MGRWSEHNWIWDFHWQRALRPRYKDELVALQGLIHDAIPSLDIGDSMIWKPHKSGLFSVKSLCLELAKSSNSYNQEWIKSIWKGVVPPRIEVFTWLTLLGKINTKGKLASIGIIPPEDTICPLCKSSPENHNHLLLHCSFASSIWSWLVQLWQTPWVFPSTLREAFMQWVPPKKGVFFKNIWYASFFIIVWSIWKERNARIFNNTSLSVVQTQELILARFGWWIQGWGDPFPYSCADIIRNPSCLDWNGSISSTGPPNPNPLSSIWLPPPESHLK